MDIESAMLLYSLTYRIANARLKDPECRFVPFSPALMSEYLPIGLSTLKTRLKHLQAMGFIERHPGLPATFTIKDHLEERLANLGPNAISNRSGTKCESVRISPYSKIEPISAEAAAKRLKDLGAFCFDFFSGEFDQEQLDAYLEGLGGTLDGMSELDLWHLWEACRSMEKAFPVVDDFLSRAPESLRSHPLATAALLQALTGAKIRYGAATQIVSKRYVSHLESRAYSVGEKLKQEEQRELERKYASPLKPLEPVASCTPARKAQAVIAGLRARGKHGIPDTGNNYHYGLFEHRSTDRALLTDFFTAHPEWPAERVLKILETCAILKVTPHEEPSRLFYALQANNPTFFVRYALTVMSQLDFESDWSHTLNEEWLEKMDRENDQRKETWRQRQEDL